MAKVMLVEDDNNLREIYEARMQAEGYDVVSAKDGEEALVVAKAESPELIISDVMMPKISGFEMLDILRNTDGLKDVKVIMLTALGQADDQQRADRLGADRYLVKSQVTLEDIVNVAHQLLNDVPTVAEPAAAASEPVAAPPAEPVAVAAVPVPEPVVTPAPSAIGFSAVQVESPTIPVTAPPAELTQPAVPAAPSEPVMPITEAAAITSNAGLEPIFPSAAQEEAIVEAQIEDFVTGASSEAPAMVDPAPAEPAEPVVSPEAAANAVTDDKIMADAVDSLIASTVPGALASPIASPVQPLAPPETPAPAAPNPAVDPAPTAVPTIAGKKLITPLTTEAKPDINDLLAREEAKELLAAPATVAPLPPPSDKPDPSSISL